MHLDQRPSRQSRRTLACELGRAVRVLHASTSCPVCVCSVGFETSSVAGESVLRTGGDRGRRSGSEEPREWARVGR